MNESYWIGGRQVSHDEFLLHTEQAAIWAREAVENAQPRDEQVIQ